MCIFLKGATTYKHFQYVNEILLPSNIVSVIQEQDIVGKERRIRRLVIKQSFFFNCEK